LIGVTVVVVLELAGWVDIGRAAWGGRWRRRGKDGVRGARRRREERLRERIVVLWVGELA
jgi:hypothetical protein